MEMRNIISILQGVNEKGLVMDKVFNIGWSTQTKLLTVFVLLLVIAVFGYQIVKGAMTGTLWGMAIILFVVATLGYFAMLSPISLRLTEEKLIINKLIGSVQIPYTDIKGVDLYHFSDYDIRVLGSGGYCGFTGKFRSKSLGTYTAYVGNTKEAVYIQTKAGKYIVFSCENREEAVNDIRQRLLPIP